LLLVFRGDQRGGGVSRFIVVQNSSK